MKRRANVADWHRSGLKVGFANGCFDLIHPGHVRLLSEARAACDRLVVALNTDASVKRLKGPTRPLQNEMARATVMASMSPVDLVILFDEDTPLEMIQALRPDVLVKGSDYTVDQVVGGDLVKAWGGKVFWSRCARATARPAPSGGWVHRFKSVARPVPSTMRRSIAVCLRPMRPPKAATVDAIGVALSSALAGVSWRPYCH